MYICTLSNPALWGRQRSIALGVIGSPTSVGANALARPCALLAPGLKLLVPGRQDLHVSRVPGHAWAGQIDSMPPSVSKAKIEVSLNPAPFTIDGAPLMGT